MCMESCLYCFLKESLLNRLKPLAKCLRNPESCMTELFSTSGNSPYIHLLFPVLFKWLLIDAVTSLIRFQLYIISLEVN